MRYARTLRVVTIAAVIDELRVAVEALSQGDLEPFVALIDENSEWRGIASGRLWWKQQPS
jgi:ketosteroid isomerase-like protein